MILLETIVSSLDDARAAAAGGADRFELCSALALGGLTPSLGTLKAIKETVSTPVMCMVRPREGGMAYTEGEYAVMERDALLALEVGADGLVFGFLTSDGEVDLNRCRRFITAVTGSGGPSRPELVFHRAFDVVARPEVALEQLIDLGVTRILTSGRAARATEGLDEIRRMVERADGRIEILPGGGIRAETVAEVVRRTGCTQVHLSATAAARDISASHNPAVRFGVDLPPTELEFRAASEAETRRIRQVLEVLG